MATNTKMNIWITFLLLLQSGLAASESFEVSYGLTEVVAPAPGLSVEISGAPVLLRERRQADEANVTATQPPAATSAPATAQPGSTPSLAGSVDIDDPTNPFKDADVIHDDHKYYKSEYMKPDNFEAYWPALNQAITHSTLSKGHRVAAVIPLKFNFSFYGHDIKKITVATGGFIYMSPFLHQWLTATQYIAPLMANFDPSYSTNSTVVYQSEDTRIIVEWQNMHLQDQQTTRGYHFRATLFNNDTITFAYKEVPAPVVNISNSKHPVKIGLSDAYYNDTYVQKYDIKRRTIYEYHKVQLNTTRIISNSVVNIKPMPTCNTLKSCDTCTRSVGVSFSCKWCNKIARCSDGLDWYRQHWDQQGCRDQNTVDSSACSGLPAPTHANLDPHDTSMYDFQGCKGGDCGGGKSSGTTVVVVLCIALILTLVIGLGSWVYYAYTHPTSKSGMWLMEHRPSQLGAKIKFWKGKNSSGAKYQTDTEA